jgi:hypothetical protein
MEKGSQWVGMKECSSETVAIPPMVDRSSALKLSITPTPKERLFSSRICGANFLLADFRDRNSPLNTLSRSISPTGAYLHHYLASCFFLKTWLFYSLSLSPDPLFWEEQGQNDRCRRKKSIGFNHNRRVVLQE